MKKRVTSLIELEKVLREKLQETDKSLREIEGETGLSSSRLGDFKNGKYGFPLPKLNTLANYFEVYFRIENW